MDYTLSMTFLTESGEKSNLLISDVKEDISRDEAIALMETIISNNIFENSKGAFIDKYAAQLTEKAVTKFEI